MNRILSGPPEKENLNEGTKSLGEYFIKRIRDANERIILVESVTRKQCTASEFLRKSLQFAVSLKRLGIKSEDRIAIFSENHIEYCIVIFGTLIIGATVVPISPFYSEMELNYSYEILQPLIVFASSTTVPKILSVYQKKSIIKHVTIVFDRDYQDCIKFDDFINATDEIDYSIDELICEPQDINQNVAVILTSSGTSGMPKGAEFTQYAIFSHIHNLMNFIECTTPLQSVAIVPLPLSYISGFFLLLGTILKPLTAVLLDKFNPHSYLQAIETFKVRALVFNNSMINFICNHSVENTFDLSSIQLICYGGVAVSRILIEQLKLKLKHVILVQMYGTTECYGVTHQSLQMTNSLNSLGVLQSGTQGKVISLDTGHNLGPNEYGELCFKNSRMMKGYIGNPMETLIAFDSDGFFRTGDIGYYNDSGEWFIVDRIKEVIKYCGIKVFPANIELVLMSHPAVENVCVVGTPNIEYGEVPVAFVVKRNINVTAGELISFVADNLSPPHYLRGGVIFMSSIPESSSGNGKPFRRQLKALIFDTVEPEF